MVALFWGLVALALVAARLAGERGSERAHERNGEGAKGRVGEGARGKPLAQTSPTFP
jgi:hypothetical protein